MEVLPLESQGVTEASDEPKKRRVVVPALRLAGERGRRLEDPLQLLRRPLVRDAQARGGTVVLGQEVDRVDRHEAATHGELHDPVQRLQVVVDRGATERTLDTLPVHRVRTVLLEVADATTAGYAV